MRRILIIDDESADQYIAQRNLNKYAPGMELHLASDGAEGLEILKASDFQFDVILLDINMPRMSGHEFLKEFDAISDGYVPVVVMLTSSNQTTDKEKTSAFDCVKGYLLKPLSKENIPELVKVIDSLATG